MCFWNCLPHPHSPGRRSSGRPRLRRVRAAALGLVLTLPLLFPKSFHTNAGLLYTAKRSPQVVMDTGQRAQTYSQTKYDL